MQNKLFGTDGVRGIANKTLMPETAYKIGKALALIYSSELTKVKVIIGKDTRVSSDMIESALISGIMAQGADVVLLGVIPSGGVSYLAKKLKANAGVMITASHNEASYNGIKIFNGNGYKITRSQELQIEQLVYENDKELVENKKIGQITRDIRAIKCYQDYLVERLNGFFNGLKVCLDCANGAGRAIAPSVFKKLGVQLEVINNKKNGLLINKNCGATSLDSLSKKMKSGNYDIGFALDGDADRLMVIDEKGKVVAADDIIFLLAKDLKIKNMLESNIVVGTVMSNFGLEIMLKENGIKLYRTKVGDKYVTDYILEHNLMLGGESSGHFIFKNYVITADGILSAINILKLLKEYKKPLSELLGEVKKFPQILINIIVDENKKSKL